MCAVKGDIIIFYQICDFVAIFVCMTFYVQHTKLSTKTDACNYTYILHTKRSKRSGSQEEEAEEEK